MAKKRVQMLLTLKAIEKAREIGEGDVTLGVELALRGERGGGPLPPGREAPKVRVVEAKVGEEVYHEEVGKDFVIRDGQPVYVRWKG